MSYELKQKLKKLLEWSLVIVAFFGIRDLFRQGILRNGLPGVVPAISRTVSKAPVIGPPVGRIIYRLNPFKNPGEHRSIGRKHKKRRFH